MDLNVTGPNYWTRNVSDLLGIISVAHLRRIHPFLPHGLVEPEPESRVQKLGRTINVGAVLAARSETDVQ